MTVTNNLRRLTRSLFASMSILFLYSTIIVDLVRTLTYHYFPQAEFTVKPISYILYIGIAVYFYFDLLLNFRRRKGLIIIAVGIVFIALNLYSYQTQPLTRDVVVSRVQMLLLRLLPAFMIGINIGNGKQFLTTLMKMNWLGISYLTVLFMISIFSSTAKVRGHYLTSSHNLIVPTAAFLYGAIFKKDRRLLAAYFFLISYAFFLGSRASLAYIILPSFILFLYYLSQRGKIYAWMLLGTVLSLLILLILGKDLILPALRAAFPNSRTITLMQTNRFFELEARKDFLLPSIEAIRAAPFAVRGLYADGLSISKSLNISFHGGIYAHNLFVELLSDFGVILGGLAGLFIVFSFGNALLQSFKQKNDALITIMLFLLLSHFIESLVSGTFTSAYSLWLGIGLAVSALPIVFRKRCFRELKE